MANRADARTAGRPVLRCAAAALLAACGWAAPAASADLDPARQLWSELRFRARKFIFTAETVVRLDVVPADAAAAELLPVAERAPLMPSGGLVARIQLDTTGLGRHSRDTTWLEPATGAVLQTAGQEFGRRARLKTQRFTPGGVAISRCTPAAGEQEQPANRWTQHSDSFQEFPAEGRRAGIPISDAAALFWILAVRPLADLGDGFSTVVMSRSRLLAIDVKVIARRTVDLDIDEVSGDSARHVEGEVAALDLTIKASPLGGAADDGDLEFLGMRGDVHILLDPARRVPLEISGRVPAAGTVTVKLRSVTLRGGLTAP